MVDSFPRQAERVISAGIISRLYCRRGVDHLREVNKEDFSEGYSDRANNATLRNRILWRELFPRSVASPLRPSRFLASIVDENER